MLDHIYYPSTFIYCQRKMNPLKVHVWKYTLELSKCQFHLKAEKYLENKWWSVSFEFVWFNNNHETLPSTWMETPSCGWWLGGEPCWAERWWRAAFKVKLTITGGGDQAGDSHTVTGSTFVSNNNTILRHLSTPTVRPSVCPHDAVLLPWQSQLNRSQF